MKISSIHQILQFLLDFLVVFPKVSEKLSRIEKHDLSKIQLDETFRLFFQPDNVITYIKNKNKSL